MRRASARVTTGRASAAGRLARLRRRLTLAVLLLAGLGLTILATTTWVVDGQLRGERHGAQVQGQAERAAALVFQPDDADGPPSDAATWDVSGVLDDTVAQEVDAIAILLVDGTELYSTAAVQGMEPLAEAAFQDVQESGVQGVVDLRGAGSTPAAAAPFFVDDGAAQAGPGDGRASDDVAGAVVVAIAQPADPDHTTLGLLVSSIAALLTLASGLAAWVIAGRVVTPMGAALDREEAFLATAAHELRTPLARARAAAEVATLTARDLPPSPETDQLQGELRRVVEVSAEAASSVEDLLVLGRLEAGQLRSRAEPVRLDELVADLEVRVPELAVDTRGPVEVTGDATLLRHAIGNVIGNASRHGRRPGASLLVEARVRAEDGHAVVVVRDNGPGFGVDDHSQLFDRHTGSGQGSGLGLWIVRSIVQEHGGAVEARDRIEDGVTVGAEVVLRLPST